MRADELGFWARLWLALILPWKILFNGLFAARVQRLVRGEAGAVDALPASTAPTPQPAPAARDATPALQILAILQREGRFIDFLQEDVTNFSDAEIGAAARVVHEGCRRGLREYLDLAPVRPEREGASIVLEPGFDPAKTRITGAAAGEPPFRGRLAHHGWQVIGIRLPSLSAGHDPNIVAPAEVEILERSG